MCAADLSKAAFRQHLQTRGKRGKNRNFQPLNPKEFVNVTQINMTQDGFPESAESLKHQLTPPSSPSWHVGEACKSWGVTAAPLCLPRTAAASSMGVCCEAKAQQLESRKEEEEVAP